MATTDLSTTDVRALRAMHSGEVVAASDAGYDDARQAFNLALDQRPAVVAYPSDEADVIALVRYASAQGLRVAPQATGHNAGPLGDLSDTILVKTSRMRGAEIDVAARRARANAGAQWMDVTPQASELGLAALHGSAPDVGIVGYSLGGGMGWYARKLGLQANSVTAIELVNADGELIRTDHDNEPELFWALRGGVGANFGVVTAVEFDLYPLEQVYAGVMFFPWERSSEVLHAWHELTPSLPEEITSVGRILQFPPFPEIPEPMRGKSFAVVEAAYIGDEADGAELLRPVRELGPAMDTFAMVPPVALSELHMDPPEPVPYIGDGYLIGDLPAKAIDDLVEAAGPDSGSPLISVELRQTGGALARSAPHHGAVASLPGEYVYYGVGMAMGGEADAAVEGQLARVEDAIGGHRAGTYLNFAEERTDMRDAFAADHHGRLQAAREKYNPDRLFRANHEIA